MTPSKRVDTERNVTQYGEATKTIDDATRVLENYAGAAGLAGKATRMGERVGNIFGSNDTDREQFMRDIKYLQTLAPQLLTDRHGRPLSSEAGSISDIIGGLSLGDTTANTIRSLEEIKRLYAKMREDNTKRLGGTWTPAPASSAPAAPASGGSWRSAPLVQ